ncbi:phospholipase D-like domain-containing protein [Pelagibacterales bacterium]|nr:phospholipase D-like domain-containing protein [Pelagibacterales bacterium]
MRLIFVMVLLSMIKYSYADSLKIITNTPIDKIGPSSECNEDICYSLLELIDNSNSSIEFAIYGVRGQPKILDALKSAKDRGVEIRGVLDKDVNNKSYYRDTPKLEKIFKEKIRDDFNYDLETKKILSQKKYSENNKCQRPKDTNGPLQCFEGKGYASKNPFPFKGDIMHNKFFIIDDQYVWTGSANISDTGIGGYNANNVVVLDSKFFAKYYLEEFEQLYSGKFHRRKAVARHKDISKKIDSANISLVFSPKGYAMEKIFPIIKDAKQSIDIPIFFLTHNAVSKELVKAHNRGVAVRVIIDATGASNGYSKHQYLRDNGIKVKVENWGGKMHMKTAIIDQMHIIIGSMNWTKNGVTKNDENTLIIKNAPAKALQLSKFFNEMWLSIPDKWLDEDTKAESQDSINSCTDKIDNDFDKLIDNKDIKCL